MYQGTNKTALSSQSQIADAIVLLLRTESFDKISISQICREAGVSRQTFYSLFSSKEAVIVFELKRKYCLDLESVSPCSCKGLTLQDIADLYSRYICSNASFLALLSENGILHCLTDSIYSSFYDCDLFMNKLQESERRFLASFLSSGLTGIAECFLSVAKQIPSSISHDQDSVPASFRHQDSADACSNRVFLSKEEELADMIHKLFSGRYFS